LGDHLQIALHVDETPDAMAVNDPKSVD
jgi:hypothetical protein